MQATAQPPKVELEQVRVEDMSLTNAKLIFDLSVMNPNPTALTVDAIDYKLKLNNREFAAGRYNQTTELAAKQTTKVGLPVHVAFEKVFDSLIAAVQKPETDYEIEGTAQFGVISIPFNEKGKLNWAEEIQKATKTK